MTEICFHIVLDLKLNTMLKYIFITIFFSLFRTLCFNDSLQTEYVFLPFLGSKFPGKSHDVSLEASVIFDTTKPIVKRDEMHSGLNSYIQV